jgi:hypothetical protein
VRKLSKRSNYLEEKIQEFVYDKPPLTQSIVLKTFELVQERNLSVEALAKIADREIDRLLRATERGGDAQ